MRLPAMAVSVICGPLSFVPFGIGIGKHMPWIVPVIGIGLRKLDLTWDYERTNKSHSELQY
jgi:hypothetical protein